jgi:hypothetical protein
MSKFNFDFKVNGTEGILNLSGVIDEDVDFSQYKISPVSQLSVFWREVRSINSCGIREWIKWLAANPVQAIYYFECPKIIVDQINMVQGFLPKQGKVRSFFVPYFEEDSGEEKEVLFSYGKEFDDSGIKPPQEVLSSQGRRMEMDVVEAKYFRFLRP